MGGKSEIGATSIVDQEESFAGDISHKSKRSYVSGFGSLKKSAHPLLATLPGKSGFAANIKSQEFSRAEMASTALNHDRKAQEFNLQDYNANEYVPAYANEEPAMRMTGAQDLRKEYFENTT